VNLRRLLLGRALAFITALAVMSVLVVPAASADVASEIADKQRRIQELERQIEEFQRQADTVGAQSRTLESEVRRMNSQIGQLNAQIVSLETGIEQAGLQIDDTSRAIGEAERKIGLHQDGLAASLRATSANDRQPLALAFLRFGTMSEFFDYVHAVQRTQDTVRLTIRSIRELRDDLDDRREGLESERADLERMKGLQELQQGQLASVKRQKDTVLKATRGEEARFQTMVKQSTQDLQRLREQINYLISSGISVEDAVKYAQLAAIGAGIRPAFLLALLEVESRLGRNVGTGNWNDDMYQCYLRLSVIAKTPQRKQHFIKRANDEKNAFMAIIGKLGLDPASVKVSREPSYGCGGAMGPAQFIPTTWLGYEAETARITGHSPVSPWNFQDAFTASAIKLARGGATSKDRAGEIRAAKAYISGNSACATATCINYANTIQQKAAAIEQDL
jgi:membrane-bound lytic murein transglycosylase B